MRGISMRENREVPRSPVLCVMHRRRAAREGRGRKPEMHDRGKSDRPVVPAKPPNKAAAAAAEAVEGRGPAKGNAAGKTRPGRRAGHERAKCAGSRAPKWHEGTRTRGSPRSCTTSTSIACGRPIGRCSPQAAPGVDGVTWEDYGQDLEANLRDLHARVHAGRYRAKPSRRAYIPKADGRLRPLGIAALEDKILQRAVVEVLNAIYEADFLGFSYGFRPGRSPHDALDALAVGIDAKKVNWVLDADIRDFFTSLDHGWLEKFLEHRIADERVLRLIQQVARAQGSSRTGRGRQTEEGTPQGASASPLLANVYLHYVFDLWADQWRRRHARGDVIIVRFADDYIVGFEHQRDAERFLADLREQAREVRAGAARRQDAPDRVRAVRRRATAGARSGQAGDVRLPGLHAHLREDAGTGASCSSAITIAKRMRAKLREVKDELHATPASAHPRAGPVAGQRGARALRLLRRARQQRAVSGLPQPGHPALVRGATAPQPAPRLNWERMNRIADPMAPTRPHHASLPRRALRRPHPRQEPSALAAHAGICAGGRPQGRSLPGQALPGPTVPWMGAVGASLPITGDEPGNGGRAGWESGAAVVPLEPRGQHNRR